MEDFFSLHFVKYYDDFVKKLALIFPDNSITISKYEQLEKQDKLNRGVNFNSLINTNELFDLLVNSKIKLFSHKDNQTLNISICLFDDKLALKNILNNQPDEIKKTIWHHIQKVYLASEVLKPQEKQNKERIGQLSKLLFDEDVITQDEEASKEHSLKILQNVRKELLNHTNDITVEMFDDIVKTFESLKGNFGVTSNKKDQMIKILAIGKKLASKYKTKLTDGTIEVGKIMDTICRTIPELAPFAKMFGGMMPTQQPQEQPQERIVIDEEFSTAQVPLGKQEQENGGIKIGDALKMADTFGALPFGDSKSENSIFSGLKNLGGLGDFEGFGDLGEIFELLKSGKEVDETQIEKILDKAGISKNDLKEMMENISKEE